MSRPATAAHAARGRITALDLDAVRAAPGVVAVLTAADIPGRNDCSPVFGDDPILADGRIAFHGQVVFAVAGAQPGRGPPRLPPGAHRGR